MMDYVYILDAWQLCRLCIAQHSFDGWHPQTCLGVVVINMSQYKYKLLAPGTVGGCLPPNVGTVTRKILK